jgi:hypothetical protein
MSEATTGGGDGGQQAMDDFVQMSALLTGFAAAVIAPSLDPVDLKTTLFRAAQQGGGAAFDRLLAQYAQLSGGTPVAEMSAAQRQSIGDQLLGLDGQQQPDAEAAATARSVNRLWYLGYWYPIDGSPGETVVSDQAYIRGLAWKAMQSHAMGYSTLTYGYWAAPPPPLADFTGNAAPAAPAGLTAAEPALPAGAAAVTAQAWKGTAPSTLGQGKGGQSPADLVEGRR